MSVGTWVDIGTVVRSLQHGRPAGFSSQSGTTVFHLAPSALVGLVLLRENCSEAGYTASLESLS